MCDCPKPGKKARPCVLYWKVEVNPEDNNYNATMYVLGGEE